MKSLRIHNFAEDWDDIQPRAKALKPQAEPKLRSLVSWVKRHDRADAAIAKLVWGSTTAKLEEEILERDLKLETIPWSQDILQDLISTFLSKNKLKYGFVWSLCSTRTLILEDALAPLVESEQSLASQAFRILWFAKMLILEGNISAAELVVDLFGQWLEGKEDVHGKEMLKEMHVTRHPKSFEDQVTVLCFLATWGMQNGLFAPKIIRIENVDQARLVYSLPDLEVLLQVSKKWKESVGCPISYLLTVSSPQALEKLAPDLVKGLE